MLRELVGFSVGHSAYERFRKKNVRNDKNERTLNFGGSHFENTSIYRIAFQI